MSETGWQEWCRDNITNSGLNPKSAAVRAWVHQKAKIDERDKRIALLEAAILEYRTFRWKPDSRGWCLPYSDEERKLFAVLQEDKPR